MLDSRGVSPDFSVIDIRIRIRKAQLEGSSHPVNPHWTARGFRPPLIVGCCVTKSAHQLALKFIA